MPDKRDESMRRDFEVDGESFSLTVSGFGYEFTWLTGPNPGYGFGGTLVGVGTEVDRAAMLADLMTDQEATLQIRSFLEQIDPATGYLAD